MIPSFWQGLEQGIYWITPRIAIGRFATVERCQHLLAQGVTHILNVAECPASPKRGSPGFKAWWTSPSSSRPNSRGSGGSSASIASTGPACCRLEVVCVPLHGGPESLAHCPLAGTWSPVAWIPSRQNA